MKNKFRLTSDRKTDKQKTVQLLLALLKIMVGCSLFSLGFNLFLVKNDLNAGGISGLSMLFVAMTHTGSVGMLTAILNLPLFIIGGWKLGRRFFWSSLLGMLINSVLIDAFAGIPVPNVEPLLAVLYGGVMCGLGLGFVFSTGASTGGSDIIVLLLKLKYRHVPIGTVNAFFDAFVVLLTGLTFMDVSRALYSGIAVFVTGKVIDVVVYRFDYSKVALIISEQYEEIAKAIDAKLERGATFLNGEGSYTRKNTKVILTAVKRRQIADLKQLVVEIDPKAFIIVQEAHQVLGDGFSRYSNHSL